MKRVSNRKLRRLKSAQTTAPARRIGRILAGSIAAIATVSMFLSPSPSRAATLFFDADLDGTNGITELGGTFGWTPGTTATFINPLVSPVTLITGTTADVYQFGGNSQTLLSGATVNITSGSNIAGLIFGATGGFGYTVSATSAQTLNLGASGIAVSAGAFGPQVGSTNLGLTLGGAQSWTNASANTLTIGGAITNSTNLLTLVASGAGDINVTGSIVGTTSGGITVNSAGTGRVILSGTNTQTGTTTLTAGLLRATTATAFGTGALQLNGGTLQLADDTGLNVGRNTTVGGTTTILSDRTSAGAATTQTLGTLSLGAFTMNVGAGAFATSGTAGLTFGAVTLTGAGTINTNNSFFNSAVTTLTTLASVGGNQNVTFGGTGTTTVTGLLSGTGALTLTKNGTGTLNLNGVGSIPGTGVITINGGTVNIGSGGVLASRNLTFGAANTGGGTFNFNAASTATNQGLGALSFLGGDGVVQSTYGAASGNASITFGSLAARTAGASGFFVASGGANGTTNKIVLTGVTPGANGIVIGGGAAGIAGTQAGGVYFFNTVNPPVAATPSDYAVYDTGGFVRAINYSTDTTLGNTVAAAATTLTASSVNQITTTSGTTGTVTLTGPATVTGLNLTGTTTLATAANAVTTPSILKAGGGTGTISSTTGGSVTAGTADLVIRTDSATDILTVTGSLGGAGLTKTGLGTLNLNPTVSNTFTGNIFVNSGILGFNGNYNNVNTSTSLGATLTNTIFLNGGTLRNNSGVTFNPQITTRVVSVGLAGGTYDLNGQGATWDDGSQLTGAGNLTFTNSNATAATVTLGGTGGNTNSGTVFLDPNSVGAITLLIGNATGAGTAGNTVVLTNNKSAVDFRASSSSNFVLGGTGISGAGAIISGATGGGTASTASVTLTANTLINNANTVSLNGLITDNGRGFAITKNGAGTLFLGTANTFSGGVTLSVTANQKLSLGNSAALGSGTLTVASTATGATIDANANILATNSVVLGTNTTFGQATGNINPMTFGALDLGGGVRTITVNNPASNALTFTGPVTNGTGLILAGTGTLALPGASSLNAAVTVNGGGTLSVGASTLSTAGSIVVGTTTTSGLNFNADNIGKTTTLAANTTVALGGASSQALLGFQLGNPSYYDSLNLTGATGNLTVGTAGAVISIAPLTGFTPAASSTNTYNLITTTGGGTISGFANLSLPFTPLPTGYNYTFNTTSTSAVLTVSAGVAGNLFWRGDVNNSWNGGANTANTNWNDATDTADAGFTPNATNTAVFSSTALAGATPVTTTLDQNFSIAGLVVNSNNTGALAINQGTTGALTIGTGGITVNTGGPASTTINAPVVVGGNQTWTVADGTQTLSIQGGAPAQGVVSGTGSVTLAGAGKVTLGGFNTFSGGLTTGAGQVNINNGGSTTTSSALGTGAVNFAGATTTLDNTSGVSQSVLTTGAQTWSGNIVFTGTSSLSLGTGTINLNGANRTVTVNGGTLVLGGVVQAAAFGITKAGNGALTLSGANLNTGQFVLSAGKVNVNSAAALGAATGTVALNGGSIDNTSNTAVVGTTAGLMTFGANVNFLGSAALTLPGAVTLTADRTLTAAGPGLGAANPLILTGIISGAFNLIKDGAGSVQLGGANTFGASKTFTLSNGTVIVNNAAAFGATTNTFIINGGATPNVAIDAGSAVTYTVGTQNWNSDFAVLGTQQLNMNGASVLLSANRTITEVGVNRFSIGGAVSGGAVSLTINGNNANNFDMYGVNTYTGATILNAGAILNLGMNNGTASAAGQLASTTLTLNGGTLNYTRTGAVAQGFAGGTSIGSGAATISESVAASQTLNLGALGRTASNGGTVNFSITGTPAGTTGITTSTGNAAGILGGWATLGGLNWAVGNGATSSITAYGAYTASTAPTTAPGAGTNVDFQASNSTAWTTQSVNSLAFRTAAITTLTLTPGNTLTLDSGGILVNSTVAANASVITGGTVAITGDLIVTNFATSGTLAINSVISSVGLTKSGTSTGAAIIGGSVIGSTGTAGNAGTITNAMTGTVTVNAGVLQVNGSAATGGNGATGTLNSLPITLNGGTLSLKMDDSTGTSSPANIALTDAVTVNGNATILVDRLGAGSTPGTSAFQFSTPLNKTVQLSTLNFGNAGRTLTVTTANGYGLEFTGITTLDKNLTTINVGPVTQSNVIQGLTLSGKVTGTIAGGGGTGNNVGAWTKAGLGTLVLNNATNDFSGNIILSAGTLAVTAADAATEIAVLGNTANTITFTGATAGTTLRAYGGTVASPLSFATPRTINLWGNTTANNVIEVADTTTLTLNSAFGGGNSPFTKADLGTLVLAADNGIWAGQLSISAGAVRVTNSGALGISTATATGNTVVAATGGALQLSNVSIWDQLNLTGSGINSGGALQALTGITNTTNGLITGTTAPTIGADLGATLNIRGGYTGAQLTFAGAGSINVDTNSIGNPSTGIIKIGSGTTTLGVANPAMVGTLTVNAGTLAFGGSAGSVGGSGAITINGGGTLSVDNSVGTGLNNRLFGGRAITIQSGNFNYVGNASVPSVENLGALGISRGADTFTVTAGANAGAGLIFGAPTRGLGGTALFRGSNLGSAPGNGVATIASTTTGFTFVGAGAAGTITKGILPWALVDASVSGTGTSFATADTATGNLRPLTSNEYVTTLAGFASSANVVLGAAGSLASSFTVNSLTLNSSGSVTVNPLQTLTVGGGTNSGGILAQTSNGSISGGLLTNGANSTSGSDLIFHNIGDLTVDSVIVGSVAGSNPYLTKTGAGILTLNKSNPYIGQTVINQGTLKLAGGNNTIFYSSGNSFLAINGGTLDLNGNSQQVQGLFTDSAVAGGGGTVIGASGSTLVINNDNAARNWAGTIGGSVALERGGLNVTTFLSNNDYSGATMISGGTLTLQDAGRISNTASIGIDYGASLIIENTAGTQNMTDRVKDGAVITLRGGTLTFNGRAATQSTETVGEVKLTNGNSFITTVVGGTSVNSTDLTITTLTRAAGDGTVNFTALTGGLIGSSSRILIPSINGVSTATLGGGLTNNIIGGWAIIGLSDFASYNPTYGVGSLGNGGQQAAPGFAGYSNLTSTTGTLDAAGSTDNISINTAVAGNITVTNDLTINSLRMGNVATNVVAIAANKTLTLSSGGLLFFSTANQTIGSAVNQGNLTTTGPELFVYAQGNGTQLINSVISGAGVTLIRSGAGLVTLAGTNTYGGGTMLNQGTTTLAAGATLPAGTNGLILNGGSLTQVATGVIASQAVKLNGPVTLTLASTGNSFTTLTFNVDGGAQTGPTVATGANALTLTGAGGITASGSNPNATATISGVGGLNLSGTSNFAMAVSGFSFNSQLVAPLSPTLSITATITNGGIVKTGDGLLSLAGANTYTAGTDVQVGGLIFAASTTGTVTNGPVGTGTLTLGGNSGNNLTLTADATGGRTIANALVLANSATTVNLGVFGAGTLSLSGATTWSTTTGVARTLNVNAVTVGGTTINTQTLSGVITSAGTGNGLVKTGIGTLAITANNAATLNWTGSNAVNVTGGLLQIPADTTLGAVPGSTQADNILLNGGGLSATASLILNSARGINVGPATGSGAGVLDVGTGIVTPITPFALTYGGVIANNASGVGGLVKIGTGNLVLTGVNTYTGPTTIAAGLIIANSSSSLGDGTASTNALVFSGGNLQATGAITSPATRPVSLVANATIDTNSQNVGLAGVISGGLNSGSLTKIGAGTLTLSGANTFTGATTISAGGLTLDYSAQDNSKLSDPAALTLTGPAALTLTGGTHSEIVGSTTLNPGGLITVTRSSGTAVLNLGTITRNPGGTINFGADSIATTNNTNTNGILGAWATVGGSDWATNSTNAANGPITALASYTDVTRQVSGTKTITSAAASNVRIVEGTGGSPASITPLASGTTDINTLLQSASGGTGAATYDPGTTDILRFGGSGGILVATTAGTLTMGTVANDGVLTGGGNVLNGPGTLTLTNDSTNDLLVNSTIANNGSGAVGVTASGSGNVTLAGANTFNGGTSIDAGSVTLSGVGTLGTTTNALTMNGGQLKLGGTTQTVGAVSITAPALTGNTVENGTLAGTSYAVSNATGNVIIASTLAGGAATLTKTGAGTLTLSGSYSYTGATSVNAGTMVFGGTSTGTSTVTANNSGSIIQIGSATGLTASNAVSITAGTVLDLNGNSVTIGALTSVAGSTITNTSSSTTASTATTPGTPSGTGVYVDAVTVSPASAANVTSLITDGATRKTQIVLNNALAAITMLGNTGNTFSGGLVLANNAGGNRLTVGTTNNVFGTGPIIVGQAATDKAGIFFGSAVTFNNPIVTNTALGNDRVGLRIDAAGVILSGVITANLAPVTFTSNTATGANVTLTNQVTGPSGLVIDITSLATLATSFNVTLNNATVNTNDYAGDTVINLGALTTKSATLNLGAANQIPDGTGKGNVIINTAGTGVGTLNLAGFSETINGLSGSGTVEGASGTPTLTVGGGNATGTTFSGVIKNTAGTLTLTKIGTGTQTLSGASTFTGPVNGNGGLIAFATSPANTGPLGNSTVVNLDGGGISYTASGANALNRPIVIGAGTGTVNVSNSGGNLTISSVTSSGGSLIKTGSGTATLAGVTTLFAGAAGVTVNGGTLNAGFGTGGISTLNVGAAGTMSFANATIESLTLSNATGSLTLAGGAHLVLDLSGATNDSIAVNTGGTAVAGGIITLDFSNTGLSALTSGSTYNLLTAPSGLTAGGATYAVGSAPLGFNYSITATDMLVSVGIVTFSPKYWRGGQNASWATLGASSANWTTDATGLADASAVPGSGDTVIFSASNAPFTSGTQIATTLDGNSTIFSLQFAAAPTGVTSVQVNQGTSGTLTIQPTSTNSGIDVAANAGAATISAPVVASGVGAPTQTWNVDGTGANGSSLTLSGPVTFNANVNKTGAGTLTLSNASNSGTSNFTLSAGTVSINANTSLPTGVFTIGLGTTVNNAAAGLVTLANTSYNWNGDFTQTGQSMDLGSGAVTLGANVQTTVTTNTVTVGGTIGDGGNTRTLTKAGAGTLILNGNNSYGGLTTLSAGVLTLAGANTGAGGVTLTTGTLNLNNASALGTGRLTLNGGIIDSTNVDQTLTTNNLQTWGTGASVAFTGTKKLNLGTGAVTFGTDATVGAFTLTNNSALSGTSLTFGGAITPGIGGTAGAKTLTIAGAGSTALTGSITKGTATSMVVTVSAPGTTTLSGAASNITTLNVNGGASSIIDIGAGNLTLSNGGANGIQASAGGTINATGGGTITLGSGGAGNNLDNGTANGTTLTINAKIVGAFGWETYTAANNTGTTILTAQNTFAQDVYINGGNLQVSSVGNTGSTTSNLGAGTAIHLNGTPSGAATATTSILRYTGSGETSNRAIDLSGTTIGGAIEQAGTGLLKFTAANTATGLGVKTLYLMGSTAGTGEISGLIVNNSGTNTTGVTKLGTGLWTLSGISATAASNYTGATTIEQGTLAITHATTAALTGGLGFGAVAAGTNVGTLDLTAANLTLTGAATVRTNSTSANTIALGTKTLTINGGLTVGYAASAGTATTTKLTVTGAGTMAVNGTTFAIGVDGTGTANSVWFNQATLDVTALASFSTNVTTLNVGVGGNIHPTGNLLLSNTANTLIATTLTVGDTGAANGDGTSTLTLGTGTNVLQADTINIGRGKGSGPGVIKFASQTAGSPGTVTIANKAGTGAATIIVGNNNGTATAGGADGTLNLNGHVATVSAGTLTIAQNNMASNTGGVTGAVSFDAGTFTVASLNMAPKTGAGTGAATGTLSVGGGTFTVNTGFTLGSQATAGTSSATLSVTGGTFISNANIVEGGGTVTSAITLNGASAVLDLAGGVAVHDIGDVTNVINSFTFTNGTLRDIGTVFGGITLAGSGSRVFDETASFSGEVKGIISGASIGLTKTGTGTLTLSGPNTYSGPTAISAGTVSAANVVVGGGNSNLGNAASAVTLGAASTQGTLSYTGNSATFTRGFTIGGAGGGRLNVTTSGQLLTVGTGDVTGSGLFTVGGAGDTTITSNLTHTGGLTKADAGTLTLTGSNTYGGLTTVSSGTLKLNRSTADNAAIPTDGVAANNDITISGGTLEIAADEQIANNAGITMTSGAFNFGVATGRTETIGTFANSGGTLTTGANTLIGTGASFTWSGTSTNTVSTGGTIQDGHVTITGGTNTVQAGGTLEILSGTGLELGGTASPTLTLNADATTPGKLKLGSNVTVLSSLTSGTATIASSSATDPGVVDLNGATRTFTVNDGSASVDLSVSAKIIGTSVGLTKAGAGTMALAAANTYTGPTTVTGGTLEIAGGLGGSIGTTSSLSVGPGATLLASGNISNTLGTTGTSVDLAGGTLQFSGSNATNSLNLLTLSVSSTLDFGAGAGDQLTFLGFSHTAGTTLTINGWSGTIGSAGGTGDDRLIFSAATPAAGDALYNSFNSAFNQSEISFGGVQGYQAIKFGDGSSFEIVAVPEPSSTALLGAAGLLGLVGYRERRRLGGLVNRKSKQS